MRRIFWTLGMTMIGLFLALKGQDVRVNVREVAAAGIWAGCIGYGFGSIFDQRRPGRRLIVYWAATLALISPLFSPAVPLPSLPAQLAVVVPIGALVGVLVGTLQLKLARRKSQTSVSGVID